MHQRHKNKSRRYFVDLFAGCGGLSLGLEDAGFVPLLFSELNDDARGTYLMNRPQFDYLARHPFCWKDVKDLVKVAQNRKQFKKLCDAIKARNLVDVRAGELDLLTGGPPCQGFSGMGHRRSYSVDKEQLPSNYLFEDMVFLISKFRPKLFVFENVRGLLSAKWTKGGNKGEVWAEIRGTFERELGSDYWLDDEIPFREVKGWEYGVPQNRPRILYIGIRKDLGLDERRIKETGFKPKKTNDYPQPFELLDDLIDYRFTYGGGTKSYPRKASSEIQRRLRQPRGMPIFAADTDDLVTDSASLLRGGELTEQTYSRHSERIQKKFRYMISHGGKYPPGYSTKKFSQRVVYKRWRYARPNITTTSMPDDYVHFEQARSFTVREWARFQTFPDWYQFAGKRTTGGMRRAGNPRDGNHEREVPKYTQIGNAIPVKMGFEIGRHVAKIVGESEKVKKIKRTLISNKR